jgi:hypothetical protein
MLLLAALAGGILTLAVHGVEPPKDKDKGEKDSPKSKSAELMRKKLLQSQKVLEGIALNDFEKIIEHADELIVISKEAEFKALKTPRYDLHVDEFRRNAEEMVKKAKEKNIEGATLAYMELTLTCVRCHKYTRETRMTRSDGTEPVAIGE